MVIPPRSTGLRPVVCALAIGGVFVIDTMTPLGVAGWMLYLIPLMATLWLPSPRSSIVVAVASTVLLMVGALTSATGGVSLAIGAMHRAVGTAVLWTTALLIAAHKQAHETLQREHEHLSRVLSSSPVVLYSLRIESGQLLPMWISENFARVAGYSTDEPFSFTWWLERVHPDDLADLGDVTSVALAHDHAVHEYRFRHANGSYFWVRNEARILRDSSGQPVEMIGAWADITQQKCAEEVLRESDGLQQQEAEVSGALARVGRELMTALGTPTFLDRLCQVTAEALGCSASHTLLWRPEEDVYVPVAGYGATPEEQALARFIKVPRQMMSGILARLERADVGPVGTIPSDLLSSAAQQQLGLGATLCMALRRGTTLIGVQVVLARDRTEPFRPVDWRIAQGIAQVASVALEHALVVEELNQANRLKSEFVATMSHELRTPINIITGYADLLLAEEFGSLTPDQLDVLRKMNRSARELCELVNATLDLGRFEAGQAPLVVQEIGLADLISEVRAETRSMSEKPNVSVVWTSVAELPCVRTDAVKLKTVMKNLVNNAVKFTERGRVTVSAMPANDGVVFSVADTGIGIAPEVLPIIFEPFRQADSSTTRRYGGVGLGLYIVRRFVDLLGGTVDVDSEVGKGSTFRVWVPLRGLAARVAA